MGLEERQFVWTEAFYSFGLITVTFKDVWLSNGRYVASGCKESRSTTKDKWLNNKRKRLSTKDKSLSNRDMLLSNTDLWARCVARL